MMRSLPIALASAALCFAPACAAIAQQSAMQQPMHKPMQDAKPITPISEALAAYESTKKDIIGAAEFMPADKFSFKATPQIRTYAEMFTHVAQVQMAICGVISGNPGPREAQSTASTKEEVLAVIKKSFDVCDAAYNSVTEANELEVGGQGFLRGTKLGDMWKNVAHNNEMYGQMVIYLRLNGIVPPSTAERGRM